MPFFVDNMNVKNVMVLIPGSYRNFAFCGEVGEQTGPYTYVLENAFMIYQSGNGVDWFGLARGNNRTQARFTRATKGRIAVGPQFGCVVEWLGNLPNIEGFAEEYIHQPGDEVIAPLNAND
jgi:hypothetical protein